VKATSALGGLVALAMAAGAAAASVIAPLDQAALARGSDRIAIATVVDVAGRWTADRRALETVVTLATDDGELLTIVQPGGEVGTARQLIVGMPTYRVGERAQFHLRRNRGGASWRVYGWSQGKWDERWVGGTPQFAPGPRPEPAGFTTNGMVWPAARQPVPYRIHRGGSDDLPMADVTATIHAAFATWQDVPCASLTFVDAGPTDLGVAVDGENAILFIEDGWIYGEEAAGITSLTILEGVQSADVAMNGQHFRWALGPSGALAAGGTFDLQAVLTHELGHFSGLGHTQSAHDTMFYTWTPWAGQRSPSLDDKLGLCSIYPTVGDECVVGGAGCAAEDVCTATPAGALCDRPADPIGAPCNYDRVECADFCLFTAASLATGYCSRFCDGDADCPPTHHCDAASAGTMPVEVCFAGPPPAPPDAAGSCATDDHCPEGQHCASNGACSLVCRTDDDCGPAATCDPRGRCQAGPPTDAGCGCAGGPASSGALAVLVAALAAGRRRRA
jgi:MYXO-CTERM domain-containing protein